MIVNIDEQIITAKICPPNSGCTYTFTHTTRIGQMLEMAEDEFGERDKSFTLLGWEFREGIPQIWYPGNRKLIAIQIDSRSYGNPNLLLFQLAHECFHLLTPDSSIGANVLEEGAATYFSKKYMTTHIGGVWNTDDTKYDNAEILAKRLFTINGNAIKELREVNSIISRATKNEIMEVCPSLDEQTAELLSSNFNDWDGLINP